MTSPTEAPRTAPRMPMDRHGQSLVLGEKLIGHGEVTGVQWPIGICFGCGSRVVNIEMGEGHGPHRAEAAALPADPPDEAAYLREAVAEAQAQTIARLRRQLYLSLEAGESPDHILADFDEVRRSILDAAAYAEGKQR